MSQQLRYASRECAQKAVQSLLSNQIGDLRVGLVKPSRARCAPPPVCLTTCAAASAGINAPQRPDCVAGVVGLELRNVGANYPFESSHRFPGISRILASETIRV